MAPQQFEADLNLPKGVSGTLRLYITDPDNFQGGRKETIVVGGETVGTFENFQKGRWIDVPVSSEKTADGKLSIQVINARSGSNAVLSAFCGLRNDRCEELLSADFADLRRLVVSQTRIRTANIRARRVRAHGLQRRMINPTFSRRNNPGFGNAAGLNLVNHH